MGHPLDEAYAKVARAGQFLEQLHAFNFAWVDAHPYDIETRVVPDLGNHFGVAVARGVEEPIPMEIGLIAGDLAHNLRSALNYLAWQLASPPFGDGPGDHTAFPLIFDFPRGKVRKRTPPERFEDEAPRLLRGIREPYRTMIERCQPYHGGVFRNLALLSIINDTDKHRVVTTTSLAAHLANPRIVNASPQFNIRVFPNSDIYDGRIVWQEGYGSYWAPGMAVEFDASYSVGFGEHGFTGNAGTLDWNLRLTRRILRAFHGAFESE
jgi:hypothetical protein